jgi:GABA permease
MTVAAAPSAPPGSSSASRRRVLVVVDQPCTAPELCASVRAHVGTDPTEALVIAPAHGGPETQWYVDEDAARADATHRLRACVACLIRDGIRASGQLSDPEPVQAIADALHDFPADEILLISARQRPSSWLRQNAIDRARHAFEQPVEHVVMLASSARRNT